MHFIIIFGPPAVGKMAVGNEINKLARIPVFHNHLSIEPILRFFPFGSPSFVRLVDAFRQNLVQEVANSDLPGLIFTFVWGLDEEADTKFVADICKPFEDQNAVVTIVELKADLDQRLIRNKTQERLEEKPSKRNLDWSEENLLASEAQYRMNSDGSIPSPHHHLIIDNTNRSAEDVAKEIVQVLSIPRTLN
ncbi:MAG: hypothetical protein ACJAYE_002700 [Candidatus Azotimanducaceae bacterium]|jgi:hypothetical protein